MKCFRLARYTDLFNNLRSTKVAALAAITLLAAALFALSDNLHAATFTINKYSQGTTNCAWYLADSYGVDSETIYADDDYYFKVEGNLSTSITLWRKYPYIKIKTYSGDTACPGNQFVKDLWTEFYNDTLYVYAWCCQITH